MNIDIPRRDLIGTAALGVPALLTRCASSRPVAVLTFDDAVKSHRTFVAPLLADYGFAATFFVTHRWMDDRENFMDWDEIAEIAALGFEIGNHSWSHADFSVPKHAARLEGELALVENALAKVGIAKPVSFAWCGNRFGPEALRKLGSLGYRFARRGLSPELDNRALEPGAAYDPARHHRLLIPSTGDSIPGWTPELFGRVLDRASEGIVVLQFHGVPDIAHPWVHTEPPQFRAYLRELQRRDFEVLAMRDLESRIPAATADDPHATQRNPPADGRLEVPVELAQTRAELPRWTAAMLRHRYTADEAAATAGFSRPERRDYERRLAARPTPQSGRLEVWPYPGGRHPRTGFRDGAIDPLRGTKASVFLPWDPESYVVLDLPELITSSLGHLFLAHTHGPTIWNDRNVWLDNVDWLPAPDGGLELAWTLPNGIAFGASLRPDSQLVAMNLWLRNGLERPLTGLRTQLCAMLRGASGFQAQTVANKIFEPPVAAVRADDGSRWLLTAWDRAGRCWGNAECPCLHSDPVLPDCEPGETVRLSGRFWFCEGSAIEAEIAAAKSQFRALPDATARD